ncbi:hypothetical protein D3C72_1193540 [compost metagenome]
MTPGAADDGAGLHLGGAVQQATARRAVIMGAGLSLGLDAMTGQPGDDVGGAQTRAVHVLGIAEFQHTHAFGLAQHGDGGDGGQPAFATVGPGQQDRSPDHRPRRIRRHDQDRAPRPHGQISRMRRPPAAGVGRVAPDDQNVGGAGVLDQQAGRIAYVSAPFARHARAGGDLAEAGLGALQRVFGAFVLLDQHLAQQDARPIGVGHRRLGRTGRHPDQMRPVRLGQGGGLLDPLDVVGFIIDIDDQAGPGHRDFLSFQNDRTPERKFGP